MKNTIIKDQFCDVDNDKSRQYTRKPSCFFNSKRKQLVWLTVSYMYATLTTVCFSLDISK